MSDKDELPDLIQECINFEQDRLEANLGDKAPDGLIHRKTGLPPTDDEWQTIKAHAVKILSNPYASPGSVAWALDICPDGIAVVFDRAVDKLHCKEVLLSGTSTKGEI